jgi:hypothetical protein
VVRTGFSKQPRPSPLHTFFPALRPNRNLVIPILRRNLRH